MADADPRRFAPATLRNREPILAVLCDILPARGTVLEIASGSGEHAVFFAPRLSGVLWQPTDPDPQALDSIAAWTAATGTPTVCPPRRLDVREQPWPVEAADAVVCINMIHIAPWAAAQGLMQGAGRLLPPGGPLYLYGPFRRDGQHTAPSNEAFDESLRAQDPAWGVRDLEAVLALAEECGLRPDRVLEMPANNLSVVLRKG